MLGLLAALAAWQSPNAVNRPFLPVPRMDAHERAAPDLATARDAANSQSSTTTLQLLRNPRVFLQQAQEDPSTLLQLVKDAGVSGAISYTIVELTFFSVALPIGYLAWHASTGEWLQPLLLLHDVSYTRICFAFSNVL